MPDVNKAEYLQGLYAVVDALGGAEMFGPYGDRIGLFYGDSRLGVSAAALASMTVTACHEYARWLPVIEAARDFEEARREFIDAPPAERTGEQYDAEWTARHALLDAAKAIAAAIKEGSDG